MAVTAQNLIDRARERADFVSSTYLTDASWLVPCARSYSKLWNLLIAAYGKEYLLSVFTLSVTAEDAGTSIASVTGGVHKLIRIENLLEDERAPFRPFNLADTVIIVQSQPWTDVAVRYSLEGNQIRWQPIPNANQSVRLYYIKQPALAALSTEIDVLAEPWDEYIVLDLAIKMRKKEESDTADLMLEMREMRDEIIQDAADRDIGQPTRVADVRSLDDGWFDDWVMDVP